MNRLDLQRRAKIIGCLVEGRSVRSTARLPDVDKKTVLRLLEEVGSACRVYHDAHVRNVASKRVQCDEIWSFCAMKEKNVPAWRRGQLGLGDVYTWTVLCADTKLIVSWLVGRRDTEYGVEFMRDVASRLSRRVQLTTDGHKAYLVAVENAFGVDVDYAMLVELYGAPEGSGDERRYSGGRCKGAIKGTVTGRPATSMSLPATSSGRISVCAWACGASRG